ncbi:hypothetical protein CsatB_002490 [Cannabis sativa]|uniref:J domain-containing protein n=2 Tax=Cannabis sativa TaxID=3483 RepID=A0A803PLP3_CANSA|nr:uncharacterized protein LOC115716763 isoform X1 [Cannabis sativa]
MEEDTANSNTSSTTSTTTNKDYYKVLEVDYDATDETIRMSYRRLALKWHPDKHKNDSAITAKFQEINEAYSVLSDPAKRLEYDYTGIYEIDKYTLREYLARFKGMILTCNGLGISQTSLWTQQLKEEEGIEKNVDNIYKP